MNPEDVLGANADFYGGVALLLLVCIVSICSVYFCLRWLYSGPVTETCWVVVYADGRRRFLGLELVAKGCRGASLDVASRREFATKQEAAAYARELAWRSGLRYLGPFACLDERPGPRAADGRAC